MNIDELINKLKITEEKNAKLEEELHAYQAIHNLERPSYLCRETKSNQGILPSSYKQNIHKV